MNDHTDDQDDDADTGLIHVAGSLFNNVQRCTRCGRVLRQAPTDGDAIRPWPVGEHLKEIQGLGPTPALMTTDDTPTCGVVDLASDVG